MEGAPGRNSICGGELQVAIQFVEAWPKPSKKLNFSIVFHALAGLGLPQGASVNVWELLGTSGSLWELLGAYGSLWEPLGASGSLWEPLGASGSLWELLGASGSFWEPLGTSEPLGISGSLWEPLGASGNLWRSESVVVTLMVVILVASADCMNDQRFQQTTTPHDQ